VDAVDRGTYLNGENISAEVSAPVSLVQPIPQVGPGQYEVDLDAPRAAVVVTIRRGEEVLERFAVAGRYAEEFERIGNDRANLRELAERTGGAVIEPGDVRPIDFRWTRREMALGPWLAGMGAVFVGGGLVRWRRGNS
jgi:hypothetical protein